MHSYRKVNANNRLDMEKEERQLIWSLSVDIAKKQEEYKTYRQTWNV